MRHDASLTMKCGAGIRAQRHLVFSGPDDRVNCGADPAQRSAVFSLFNETREFCSLFLRFSGQNDQDTLVYPVLAR